MEWLMRRVLKYGYRWLTIVRPGWSKKELYNVREQKQLGGTEGDSDPPSHSVQWSQVEIHIPGWWVRLLGSWVHPALCSYSTISNIYVNRCQTHRSLALGPTLYKFIVLGSLGLNPIHIWAQSENCDPTLTFTIKQIGYPPWGMGFGPINLSVGAFILHRGCASPFKF